MATDEAYSQVEERVLKEAKIFEDGSLIAVKLKKPFKISEVSIPITTWFAALSLAFEKWFAKILIETKSNSKEERKNLLPPSSSNVVGPHL